MNDEELKIKIAEVMGWKRKADPAYRGAFSWNEPDGRYAGTFYYPEIPEGKYGVPDFLNDPAAALLLVECGWKPRDTALHHGR